MSDLADRVLAAIEETEVEARRLNSGWPTEGNLRVTYTDEGGTHEYGVYSPAAVLRHCTADRGIVDEHAIVYRNIGWREDGDQQYAEIPVCGRCVPRNSHFATRADVRKGDCLTMRLLARGYGITEEES